MATLHAFVKYLYFIRIGMKGENALYLDFYSMRYHLNEYWKQPKALRVQSLKEESALLREKQNG
jgi:hypothetical protein